MKKNKIASLFESIKIGGGVEKIQANLSIGLSDLGYDFTHILLEDKEPRNEYAGNIITLGEKFIFGFGLKKIIALFRVAWKVKKICNKEKINILIGQGDFFFMATGLAKLMGNKSKSIAVVHTSIGVWNGFITFILLFLIKRHDHIVMTSQQELQTFVQIYKISKKKLSLIYNSIDIKKTLRNGKKEVPEQWQFLFTNGKKTYINVARLNYQKNQQLLIKAFASIKNIGDYQLVIVGEGDERNVLENLIKELHIQNRVFLVGNQNNPHAFVAKSDYRVLSSRFEGFPMVCVEGGVFGKTMIALDCPTGPREFLDPQGKVGSINNFTPVDNGILVQYSDKDATRLTHAMEYVQNNECAEQKKNVCIYAQQFDNVNNAEKWNKLIQSLAS